MLFSAEIFMTGIAKLRWRRRSVVIAAALLAALGTTAAPAQADQGRWAAVWGAAAQPAAPTADWYGVNWSERGFTDDSVRRQQVNRWIRTSGEYDAVVDFDRIVANGDRIRAAYDSGDHIHLNDAGYRAVADSVDLDTL